MNEINERIVEDDKGYWILIKKAVGTDKVDIFNHNAEIAGLKGLKVTDWTDNDYFKHLTEKGIKSEQRFGR